MVIKNGLVFSEDAKFEQGEVWISEDKILSQVEENEDLFEEEMIDAADCYVIQD